MPDTPLPPLPERFAWRPLLPDQPERGHYLCFGSKDGPAIAVVSTLCGAWHTTVNLHRVAPFMRGARCVSQAQGARWLSRWIRPRAEQVAGELAGWSARRTPTPSLSRDEKREEREIRG